MADPGFPVGGRGPRGGGGGLPRWLRFENFVCQNERIWTLEEGGALGICQSRSADAKKLKPVRINPLELCTGRVFN